MKKEEKDAIAVGLAGDNPLNFVVDLVTELKATHAAAIKDLKSAHETAIEELQANHKLELEASGAKLVEFTKEVPGTFKVKNKTYRFKTGHLKTRITPSINHVDSPFADGDIVETTTLMSDPANKGILDNLVKIGAGIIEEV